jgi:hypothetical protein
VTKGVLIGIKSSLSDYMSCSGVPIVVIYFIYIIKQWTRNLLRNQNPSSKRKPSNKMSFSQSLKRTARYSSLSVPNQAARPMQSPLLSPDLLELVYKLHLKMVKQTTGLRNSWPKFLESKSVMYL